jgi:hypothetical protein
VSRLLEGLGRDTFRDFCQRERSLLNSFRELRGDEANVPLESQHEILFPLVFARIAGGDSSLSDALLCLLRRLPSGVVLAMEPLFRPHFRRLILREGGRGEPEEQLPTGDLNKLTRAHLWGWKEMGFCSAS